MTPSQFKKIRTELDLKQEELAEILCVSHQMVISHYETGFRKPSKLIQVIMSILESLPEKKRKEWLELIKAHTNRVTIQSRRGTHGKS